MGLTVREQLLLWWGRLHIGEVIRRRAVLWELRRIISAWSRVTPSRSPSAVEGEKSLRVLDAGCGRGDIAIGIARRYPDIRVDAVDIDPKLVELVRRRIANLKLRNVRVCAGDIETFSYASPSRSPSSEGEKTQYAIIYSVDVFEHLRDPSAALQNLAAALAPGGTLLIHVPRAMQRRFFRRFEQYEQHDHERDGFEPEELRELVRVAGLTVQDIRHTFGPPGALAWELFHLASGVGKWFVLLIYPVPWTLAWIDGMFRWERGNGMLVVARRREIPNDEFLMTNQIPMSK